MGDLSSADRRVTLEGERAGLRDDAGSTRCSAGRASTRSSRTRSSPRAAAWSSWRSTSPRFDLARFGAEAPRFSPRQSDLLWVVGTISQRQAPVLKRIYEQMMEPKWVLAFGTCASCGGFYDNYTTVAGHRQNHPVRRLHPGLPAAPRGGARRADAPAGQDRAQRAAPRRRQAARRSAASRARSSCSSAARRSDPCELARRSASAAEGARVSQRVLDKLKATLRRRHPRDALATSATTPRSSTPTQWKAVCALPPRRPRARLRHARRPLRRRLPGPRRRASRSSSTSTRSRKRHRIRLKARVGDEDMDGAELDSVADDLAGR